MFLEQEYGVNMKMVTTIRDEEEIILKETKIIEVKKKTL
jgi:hypothetical protein